MNSFSKKKKKTWQKERGYPQMWAIPTSMHRGSSGMAIEVPGNVNSQER